MKHTKNLTVFLAAIYFKGQSLPIYRPVNAYSLERAHDEAQRSLSLEESETVERIVIDDPSGFKNISGTGFSSSDETIAMQDVTVQNRMVANITLSQASIVILLHAAMLIKENIDANMLHLIANLGLSPVNEMSRNDMLILRRLVETRIAHCEKERDERSDKFNADTYITMKMLFWISGNG